MTKKPHHDQPRLVSIERKTRLFEQATPAEMARLRAASVAAMQRERQSRAEALAYIAAAEQPAPLFRDDLRAQRIYPAPVMAESTRNDPQPPAGRPLTIPAAATPNVWVTAVNVALVVVCLALAAWWGKS